MLDGIRRYFGLVSGSRQFGTVYNFATTISSEGLVASGVNAVLGWSVHETTGLASASLVIWDNASAASGTNYGIITLNPNESTRDWFGSMALTSVTGGLYLQVVSGSVAGAVFYQ